MASELTPAAAAPASAPRLNRKVLVLGGLVAAPLIAVLLFNLGRDPRAVRSPLVGRAAPAFALTGLDGGAQVSLESLRGKVVVLNFWATWCVPCVQEHETLAETARALPGVQFLGVLYEDEEARARDFLRARPSSYPSLADPLGRVAISYGVFGVPETFFVDGQGRIVEKVVGPLDGGTLRALVERARRGAP